MKQLIYIFTFLVLFISCTDNKHTLNCYNGCKIRLEQNDRVLNLDEHIVSYWSAYVSNISTQIPLFRRIYNSHYSLFIGIPLISENAGDSLLYCDSLQSMPCVKYVNNSNFEYACWQSDTMNVAHLYYTDAMTNQRLFLMVNSVDNDSLLLFENLKHRILLNETK